MDMKCVSCHASITQGHDLFHTVFSPHFLPAVGASLCFLHTDLPSKLSLLRFSAYPLQICSKSTCLLPLLPETLHLPEATKFLDCFSNWFAVQVSVLCWPALLLRSACCNPASSCLGGLFGKRFESIESVLPIGLVVFSLCSSWLLCSLLGCVVPYEELTWLQPQPGENSEEVYPTPPWWPWSSPSCSHLSVSAGIGNLLALRENGRSTPIAVDHLKHCETRGFVSHLIWQQREALLLPPCSLSHVLPCAGANCTATKWVGSMSWSDGNLLAFLPELPVTLIYHVAAQWLRGCQNHTAGKGEGGPSLPTGAYNLDQIQHNVNPHPSMQAWGLKMRISWLKRWWKKGDWQHWAHSEQLSQAMKLTQWFQLLRTDPPWPYAPAVQYWPSLFVSSPESLNAQRQWKTSWKPRDRTWSSSLASSQPSSKGQAINEPEHT